MNEARLSSAVEKKAFSAFKTLLRRGERVLLAVSGGSDSVSLMCLAAQFRHELDIDLAVGFVDHGLRRGVDEEFELVDREAKKLRLDVHRLNVPKSEVAMAGQGGSVQAWARQERYKLLDDLANRIKATALATAHTRDDQAETVVLRLIRGTGLDGLAAIPQMRQLNSRLRLVRPLLFIEREELRELLRQRGICWADDPSNQNNSFMRVRVRREILPLLNELQSGASSRLAALAEEVGAVITALEDTCFDEKKIFKNMKLSSGLKVDSQVFASFPKALHSRIIRLALRSIQGDLQRIEREHIADIERIIARGKSSGRLSLPSSVEVRVDRGSLYLFPRPLPPRSNTVCTPEQIGPNQWRIYHGGLGAEVVISPTRPSSMEGLVLRARLPGDRLLNSRQKYKSLVIKWKIPRMYRSYIPVLAKGQEIISCPFFGLSRDQALNVKWMLDEGSPLLDVDFADSLKLKNGE